MKLRITALSRAGDRLKAVGIAMLCLLPVLGCKEESDKAAVIAIASDPTGIYKGEDVNVRLVASKPFFTEDVDLSAVSDRGLILSGLKRQDDTHAVAALETDEETEVGLHEISIEVGGATAMLQLSVLTPEQGPGTVTVERNAGSAGVEMAQFVIYGDGTSFDRLCTAEVEGADGFEVRFLDIEGSEQINVYYSISRDQEPTEATVAILDGDYRYEVPFTISAVEELDNEIDGQVLTKGQVGNVIVYHRDASVSRSTVFEVPDERVETGEAQIGDDMSATIPVRVPADYEDNTLALTAKTFSSDGAFLELVHLKVQLVEPAYVAIHDALLPMAPDTYERVFETGGVSAWNVDNIVVAPVPADAEAAATDTDDEEADTESVLGLTLSDWRSESKRLGSMDFYLTDKTLEGAYQVTFELTDGRQLPGIIAVSDWMSRRAHVPAVSAAQGDRLYLPVAVQGGDLVEETVFADGTEEIEVIDTIFIDAHTAVLDIQIDAKAYPSAEYLTLHGEEYDYGVSVTITESGV